MVQAWEDEDLIHWTDEETDTLEWGETIDNDIYTVEAYDFPRTNIKGQIVKAYVGVNLYENDVLVASNRMVAGEEWKYDGEVKIYVYLLMPIDDIHWQNDPYEPWAKIEIGLRGLTALDLVGETD